MSRQFPNTPTFHPAAVPYPSGSNHPASPHSAPGRRRALRAGRGEEHAAALRAASDRDLLAAIVARDDDALAELIARHHRYLWHIAYRHVRRDHVAHDVVATVLDTVWRKAHLFTGASEPSTWLFRVTANAAVDVLRREQVRREVPAALVVADEDLPATARARRGDLYEVVAGDVADAVAARDLAARLLAQLPTEQRRAVELVDLAGHSVAEAADALGCAEGTVKSRRARAFARLAARWTPDGEPRAAHRTDPTR